LVLTRAEIHNYLALYRTPSGKLVKKIRTSVLSSYYWCAIQAYLKGCGIQQGRHKDPMHPSNVGTRMHKEIDDARKPSKWEIEFMEKIQPFILETASEGIELARKIDDDFLIEHDEDDDVGYISGHMDELKVNDDHTIHLIDYKTKKSGYVTYYALAPAMFQLQIYAWILKPVLDLLKYKITIAHLVFLTQKGKMLGTKAVPLDYESIENEIRDVIKQFRKKPKDMIPPARYKCRYCAKIYKEKCPYQ